MRSGIGRYDIYRVFQMEETTDQLAIAEDLHNFASRVIASLQGMPDGVTVDGISVRPSKITPIWHSLTIQLNTETEETD